MKPLNKYFLRAYYLLDTLSTPSGYCHCLSYSHLLLPTKHHSLSVTSLGSGQTTNMWMPFKCQGCTESMAKGQIYVFLPFLIGSIKEVQKQCCLCLRVLRSFMEHGDFLFDLLSSFYQSQKCNYMGGG